MKMGSMSSSKWFGQTLALLAMAAILIGNSVALKCHSCIRDLCKEEDCKVTYAAISEVLGVKLICHSAYDGKQVLGKGCSLGDAYNKLTGGENSCADRSLSEVEKSKAEAQAYAQDLTKNMTPEQQQKIKEYIKDHQSKPTSRDGSNPDDPAKTYRWCSCNTDLCNSDEEDAKRKDRSKAKNNGEKIGIESRNCVVVIFLALAALFWNQ